MSEIRGFDNIDDMMAFMRQQEAQANARVTPDQAEIGYGDFWMRPYEDIVVWGYVPTEAEVEAAEGGEGADPEELEYTMSTLRDAYARGYRYGRAYSPWEPEGEWGSTHISSMEKVTEYEFESAKDHGWIPMPWWWLSFVDEDRPEGDRNLGVAIVRGYDVVNAARNAWDKGINPGGEIAGTQIPDIVMAHPAYPRNVLIPTEEARKLAE
jgi:hypothetical protein